MTEVVFVEVTASRMEVRACEIAEHTYAQGDRLQIIAIDEQQAARLDDLSGIASLLTMDYCPVEMIQQFSRVIHVVVMDNQERLEASRRYWTLLKDAGFSLRHQKH